MEVDIVQLCETQDNDCDLCYMLYTMLQGTAMPCQSYQYQGTLLVDLRIYFTAQASLALHMIAMGISLLT